MIVKSVADNLGNGNFFSRKPLPSLKELADWILLLLQVSESEEQASKLLLLGDSIRLAWHQFLTLGALSLQSEKGSKA